MKSESKIMIKPAHFDAIKGEAVELYDNDNFQKVVELFLKGLALCEQYESQWSGKLPYKSEI